MICVGVTLLVVGVVWMVRRVRAELKALDERGML